MARGFQATAFGPGFQQQSAAAAGHRYWRLSFTAVQSDTELAIADVELRTAAGGADVTGSGTATAQNAIAGTSAAGAFDNSAVAWWGAPNPNHWLKYDFGSGNAKDIVEFTIAANSMPGRAPKSWTVEWSDDDSAWTTWATYTSVTGWAAGQRRTFNASGETTTPTVASACRYWRIVVTAVDGGSENSFAEMAWRTSAGGANQTGGAGSSLDGSIAPFSGQEAAKAYDGSASTWWGTILAGAPWHLYDFSAGVTKAITEVAITARNDASYNRAPKDFLIQRSEDGVGWATTLTVTGSTGWASGETRTFSIESAPATSGDWVVNGGSGRRVANAGFNPLLRRILAARADQEALPLKKKARKQARVIEVQAAEVALSSGNEEDFRALMAQWVAQTPPALPEAPSVDLQQLFMAQVAMRVRQIEAFEQDEEEALIALLLH